MLGRVAFSGLVVGVFMSTTALANFCPEADVCFDFQDISWGSGDSAIGDYLTDGFGSAVSTDGARVGIDLGFGDLCNQYLWNDDFCTKAITINFEEEAICAMKFSGHIFYGSSGDDFQVKAYGDDGIVLNHSLYKWGGYSFDSPWIEFAAPVTKLVFTNDFLHAVGVDNLCLMKCEEPVPVPAAVLLGSLGLGMVGWLKRRIL